MPEIIMPKMSDTMEEGKVVRWLKNEGDLVNEGESIAEIETDKANVEMEAFESGVLEQILVKEDEIVPVGQPIALLESTGAAKAPEREAPKEEAPAKPAEEVAPEAPVAKEPSVPRVEATEEGEPIKASPLARRMAEEHGIDLSEIQGTGPNGRIVEADIQKHLGEAEGTPPPAEAPTATPKPISAPALESPTTEHELSKMRKTIAERMTKSKQTIPHFYVTSEIEMDWAARVRDELNSDEEQPRISFTDMVIKACAMALAEFPAANSSYSEDKMMVHEDINIGMAVALDEGLVAPVIHNADKKSLREIAKDTKELAKRARENKLHVADYTGSTFTISNLGMFDVESFVSIINPPNSTSIAIGTIREIPVVVDGQVAISKRMKATVSADHRLLDGAVAAKFLQDIKRRLESPIGLL